MIECFRNVENEKFSIVPMSHNIGHFDRHLGLSSNNVARRGTVNYIEVLVLGVIEFTFTTTRLQFFVIVFLVVVENGGCAEDQFLHFLPVKCESLF